MITEVIPPIPGTEEEVVDEYGEEAEKETKIMKRKRRSNLAEFGPSLSAKRKNESAKRELTSVVNQVRFFR